MSRWRRISLELSHSWPGEPYLRFEPHGGGPATMVAVDWQDLATIALLQGGGGVGVGIVWTPAVSTDAPVGADVEDETEARRADILRRYAPPQPWKPEEAL